MNGVEARVIFFLFFLLNWVKTLIIIFYLSYSEVIGQYIINCDNCLNLYHGLQYYQSFVFTKWLAFNSAHDSVQDEDFQKTELSLCGLGLVL